MSVAITFTSSSPRSSIRRPPTPPAPCTTTFLWLTSSQPHAVGEFVGRSRIVLHARAYRGRAQPRGVDADKHPGVRFAVAVHRHGLAVPGCEQILHRVESSYAAFGCSTTARTLGATNRA